MNPMITELIQQIRELCRQDAESLLENSGLLRGRLSVGAAPRGTMVERGDYNPAARYRRGDVVVSDGIMYVALQAGIANDVSDTAYWRVFGSMEAHDIQGAFHTASGLTVGDILTATSATTFAFAPLVLTTRWEPVTNGDPDFPEIVFDNGDVVMEEVTI
jgi:hypothetical protein